ncbi:MAG: nodulation protein NfeD, partial [Deltaproteobacteria bacterium]|nr:nodulation protein NfeD [Deltaproteobacteria bacterium]
KDVVMFPFVWRYYDRPNRSGNVNSMVGVQGIVEERLAPSGYVRVHGELWQAEVVGGGPVIGRGERV